ncbi:alpha/beta hydrolase fold domain-containing protein [Rhodopirellula sp. P2]|uniref:alpha/beta hydrolase fold domain-containing protein n=1 Tax=Rhodopirellula sp. P2 TaxID=2127060 RepID=UPI002367C8C8|nr:alpha/beta hydrolase fold domain-containing protein [Rhodopirellula sp. P2]WDQ15099.1 alpha/beta hydrolase fold domain-containing protein [Rhodopirellula sp. P2]
MRLTVLLSCFGLAASMAVCALPTQVAAQPTPQRDGTFLKSRLEKDDTNEDGQVTREEFSGPAPMFQRLDRDGDGKIDIKEVVNSMSIRRPANNRVENLRSSRDVEVKRDVVFGKGGDRDLKMHLVFPKTMPDKPLPAYVWVHGGGWQSGSKEGGVNQVSRMVADGFVGATIEYRLTGEAPFPAQIEDCKCAIRFLRAHAEEYGIDPNRIAVGGSSAGGHLVALLGTSGDVQELEGNGGWQDQSSRVQAVVDLYGPTDFSKFVTTKGFESHNRPGSPESKLLGGGEVLGNNDGIGRVNPITYIDDQDPPFLIIHGTEDPVVPMNQSQLLHEALESAGVETQLELIRGAQHGGREFATPEIRELIQTFLKKNLQAPE